MRFASFAENGVNGLAVRTKTGGWAGLLENADGFPGNLETLLSRGNSLNDAAAILARGKPVDLDRVTLLPVLSNPGKIICVGLNYADHSAESGFKQPDYPTLFGRFNSSLIAHGAPIVRPKLSEQLDYEGELVAVIGTTVRRHCSRDEAMAAVLGWTIGNDVSAREWQRSDRTFWRCKNSDTFKPMGPYLVTGTDPLSATTTVRVDGEVKASFPTGDMLFDPYDFITAMSRYITLSPGDVVWMGTDETAAVLPGQVVEISIDGLGTLANPVIEEKQP